jgi:lysophospholipase L1-like esterase
MRVSLVVSLCVLCCAVTLAARAADTAARGKLDAVIVKEGPKLDGTMDDAVWKKCPKMPLGRCTSDKPHKYDTWARVLIDPTHVYVGVYCEEPDTENLKMDVTVRDGRVWQDDSVEIFLRPDPEKPYYQFTINPRGTMLDSRVKRSAWNSSAEAKTSIQKNKAWIVTFKVPMREISAYVGKDQNWTLNINRSRQPRGGDPLLEYSWAVLNSNQYHSPREFGIMKDVDVPKRDDGVTRERTTPAPKPKLVNKGTQAGGVTIYYRTTFEDENPWRSSNDGELSITDDSISGKALKVIAGGKWSGAQLPINIGGSRDLRMAFHMKGHNFPAASCNIYDTAAGDNTTPYGHRYLKDDEWVPVLYYLYRCRYNSKASGFVGGRTHYNSVRFYGPSKPEPDARFTLDNFVIYRGRDTEAPEKVAGLEAKPAADGVHLSWKPAEDNVAPQVYVISRAEGDGDFIKIAESYSVGYTDKTAAKKAYRYRVLAVDFEENIGPWSDAVSVRSVSDPKPDALTREEKDRLLYAEHVRKVHKKGVGKVRKLHATLYGDSLTGATSYPHCARAAFRNITVNAFGFAAMRTSFGRKNVGRILRQDNPEIMFVLYGTNNSKRQSAIPPAMEDLAAIVEACETNGTVCVLGTIPPRKFSDPESKPEANYNKHVIELCHKLKIPTGYLFEEIQAAGDRRKFISGDGVHWTGAGMAVGGKAWGKALRQIRFVLRDRP